MIDLELKAQRIARRIASKIDIYDEVEWDMEMIDKVADIITTELATAQVVGEQTDAAEICAEMAREVEADELGEQDEMAAIQLNAQMGALREAERRIRAASTSLDSAWRSTGSAPKIICLCGSTRFVETWINQYQRLSDEGNIVLTVARMPPRPTLQYDQPNLKVRLDELHKRKIDLADEVFVLNVGGYIGESTRSEIEYAIAHNKPVNYLEPLPPLPVQEESK